MNLAWGLILALIGVLFVIWGRTRSDFLVYRLLVARSRGLWGDRVHGVYQFSGVLMIVVAAITALTA